MSRDTNPSTAPAGEAALGGGAVNAKPAQTTVALDVAEAARLYADGAQIRDLARHYGCSAATVYSRLRAAGVTARGRGSARTFDLAEAVRLYHQGQSTQTIGSRYGVSWMTVRNRLVEAGVTMRPAGVPCPERVGYTAYVAAHTDEAGARREGRAAADRAEPITACPTGPLWFSAAWRNGWVERREELRAKRQREWERADNRLPPGGRRASQLGQRMSRKTARERFGEAFA